MSLKQRLEARILQDGPLTIDDYMTACLHDPQGGYYATRPALGDEGDFVTAPLISQMFGELIGLWCVEVWSRMGAPRAFRLIEMGPGDGTLMSDILRAAHLIPAFGIAAELWLVETSDPLRKAQAERLEEAAPHWASTLSEIPVGLPLIIVSNELLDCLPVRQFVRTDTGWAERRVGLDEAGALSFGLAPPPADLGLPPAPAGVMVEVSAGQIALGAEVGARIAQDGGAALFIDYGRDRPEPGDTLQALSRHEKVGVLDCPGEADLTVHADFPAFAAAARAMGVETTPIRPQGSFLRALGIEQRAAALSRSRPDRAETLKGQLARLCDADEMGALFKVVAIHSPGLPVPGFED
ncbi:MAG: SAM-dependent methyltransferase [Caulobacterales bacterium 32-69-10]|nr:MAG: SAM-dependent methyltransferase [Caulobacterales bacterium 32-69-10]